MPIRNFQVEYRQHFLIGVNINDSGRAIGIRFPIPAFEQQLATLLEHDGIAPTVGSLEWVAFRGGKGLSAVQRQVNNCLHLIASEDIGDFLVGEPTVLFGLLALVFPFGEGQHLVADL